MTFCATCSHPVSWPDHADLPDPCEVCALRVELAKARESLLRAGYSSHGVAMARRVVSAEECDAIRAERDMLRRRLDRVLASLRSVDPALAKHIETSWEET